MGVFAKYFKSTKYINIKVGRFILRENIRKLIEECIKYLPRANVTRFGSVSAARMKVRRPIIPN